VRQTYESTINNHNLTTLSNIEKLISLGESETLEFKSSFNNETIETLVAFANTTGGKVLIGVNHKNEAIGVTINEESVQNWLNEIKGKTTPFIIPNVNIVPFEDKAIVIFTIQEYPIKPIATRGRYYKRIVNSNHLMSISEVTNEHLRIINSSWDYLPDSIHSLQHISVTKIEDYIKEFERKNDTTVNYTPLEFLSKQEILRDDKLTFGAYLLFVKNYCSISDIQIGRFKSDISIIDTISLNTDLLTELNEIIGFIKKHLMVELIITGEPQHQERFDYPLEVIREIVINPVRYHTKLVA
jgi:ATP-dependent DNA helicase RecG